MIRHVPPVYSPVNAASVLNAASALIWNGSHDPESALSSTYGARAIVLTESGTSALVLALQTVARTGSIVGLPAYGCIDLVAAAEAAGLWILLYDVDPETLNPDLDSVQSVLARGATTIVAAPVYGYPVDMPALLRVASRHGAEVIEDAAQAANSTMAGRVLGSFAELSILSFGRGKGTTAGGGGAILLRGQAAELRADAIRRALAASRRGVREVIAQMALFALARPMTYGLPSALPFLQLGEMVYHKPALPRAISHAGRASLLTSLRLAHAEANVRRMRAQRFFEALTDTTNLLAVRSVPNGVPGFLRFAVLDRAGTASPVPRIGITRGYPIELSEHPVTQAVIKAVHATPGARVLRDRLFTLPTHSRLGESDLRRIEGWLHKGGGRE